MAKEVKLASEAQRKLFFALCHDLGLESENAKERAKKKFGVDSFLSISSFQISELIEKLQDKLTKKERTHSHIWEVEARSRKYTLSSCAKCDAVLIEPH